MAHNQTHCALVLKPMILVVTIAVLCSCAMAQSSSGCTNVIISMSPCLNYISGNSSTPSSGCCTQLATVVKSQPQCLCEVLNGGGSSLGLNINQTQALELPRACNVQTPPTSQCNAGSPGSSPTTPSSPNSPSGSGGGANTVPSGSGSSNTISTLFACAQLLFSLLIASYVIAI
ncbi:putative plant lipid transfer protein/Par allergen [Helianthus annuus]|uniref:Plant lipid transfer protein/Par allergen n=1 Tax=Helianthus annuus TaxID=4232 RepID=A0A251SFB4_HELAN|nr:non-specific lipid-transfer protein-like protein At2g13820 isoform X1 [Helianthus annuus]KAF5768288.1 putative plant lipid transfer protein/Par allergen [Helianthus annuus]KAJ0467736.1 putative plant lipid transfer protein/Par allergen [Helianthus annuus]KAJ0839595.1 putative plant lipid transfer protein/Par allergen [Helianthus annuus]KAJ0852930.1 putative plant lipid transfer protein/Par allergen [Helianthus annuus]